LMLLVRGRLSLGALGVYSGVALVRI